MSNIICGVDLGGTKLAVGLVEQSTGRVLVKKTRYDHVDQSEDRVMDIIFETVQDLLQEQGLKEQDLTSVGVGFAGHISYPQGVCITTSNLRGFQGYPIKERLGERFSVPLFVDNDANAQACGEHLYGIGKGKDTFIFVTISTGVGGGIIINNRLLHGRNGTAGEIGHTILDPESPALCTCGNYGCAMAESSGLGLRALYDRYYTKLSTAAISGEAFETDPQLTLLPKDTVLDGRMLEALIDSGDPVANAVMQHSAKHVGILLFNLFQIFDPDLFVLGGGLMQMGDRYMNLIQERVYAYGHSMMPNQVPIEYESIIRDAGLVGAAALESYHKQ